MKARGDVGGTDTFILLRNFKLLYLFVNVKTITFICKYQSGYYYGNYIIFFFFKRETYMSTFVTITWYAVTAAMWNLLVVSGS